MVLRRKKRNTKSSNRRNLITLFNPKSPISEQYRTVRTNIQYSAIDESIKTLMVTSTGPAEGKSTTAANLAVVFAQQGRKVLLMDADLRKPTVHYTFSTPNIYGLTTVLTRQTSLENAISETEEKDLFVLTSGPIPPNPSELLSSQSMERLLDEVTGLFDVVILDTPPLLAVADPQILANQCDGTILVVYSGKTETEQVIKAKELLETAKSKVLGVVLNHKAVENSNYYYYYGKK